MAQQKAIIKEVKRHVQLNHQSDSKTTDKITQKGKKIKRMVEWYIRELKSYRMRDRNILIIIFSHSR